MHIHIHTHICIYIYTYTDILWEKKQIRKQDKFQTVKGFT